MPNGAFYGTKKSCAPLNLIYNYGDKQVYFVNDHLSTIDNLQARIRVYDIQSNLLFEKIESVESPPDSSKSILQIPELENITNTYFLDLRLLNDEQKEVSSNFYWLSTKEEILDYEADIGEFLYHTPSKEYADLTMLNSLPKVELETEYHIVKTIDEHKITVEIKNPSDKIAFFIDMKVIDNHTGEIILPIFWDDNYISLLPGEQRIVSATFNSDKAAYLKVCGWNI